MNIPDHKTPTQILAELVSAGNSPDDAWQRALDVVLAERKRAMTPEHNHVTRDIKTYGQCPRCDHDFAWHDGLYETYPEGEQS